MTRPVLLAGVLGGLLGGATTFVVARLLPPTPNEAQHALTGKAEPRSEAREVAELFVDKLRARKFDDFALDAKMGSPTLTDAELVKFKARLQEFRTVATQTLGPSSGQFELLRETALSPSLVRFVYLEKLERGGVWWVLVLYRGKDAWSLAWVDWGANLQRLFGDLT
jgi:hypothetical protein